MTVICRQKTTELDGKRIAYVETEMADGKYTYTVMFDKNTKKRFNAFLLSKGFKIGVVSTNEVIEEKGLELT